LPSNIQGGSRMQGCRTSGSVRGCYVRAFLPQSSERHCQVEPFRPRLGCNGIRFMRRR
jgi:hypothetical protein